LRRKPDRAERTLLPVWQKGVGRKKTSLKDPDLPLRSAPGPQACEIWPTNCARGHEVRRVPVAELLREQKYSLQANSKTKEGYWHPDATLE
jgi:hypothetical protein